MRVLILSKEVWRDDTNGGNVLTNMFSGIDAEFAQIYCSPGVPNNCICHRYYQITDRMIAKNILNKQPVGKAFIIEYPKQENQEACLENKTFYNFIRHFRFESFVVTQELLWKFSRWKNQQLKKYVIDFAPDIIFAPCYASHFMLSLTRFIAMLTGKPVISFISDDNYSFRQFRLSPVFWLNRFLLRYNMKKTFSFYRAVFTMTEEQKVDCENIFNAHMIILRKGGNFTIPTPKNLSYLEPIRMIYAGGIYLNRWKTLRILIQEANRCYANGFVPFRFDIYTNNTLSSKQKKALDNGRTSHVHNAVSSYDLRKLYRLSDVALHIESFDIKNKLKVRLSFSTKIVDCLESGCAVMAVCSEKQAGFAYLKRENAAICVSERKSIRNMLQIMAENRELLALYAEKAYECGIRNHKNGEMQHILRETFNIAVSSV